MKGSLAPAADGAMTIIPMTKNAVEKRGHRISTSVNAFKNIVKVLAVDDAKRAS